MTRMAAIAAFVVVAWPTLGLSQTSPASPAPGEQQSLKFTCHVAAGPRLQGCRPSVASALEPGKIETLIAALERMRSCEIGPTAAGANVERSVTFVDTPQRLEIVSFWPRVIVSPDWAERPAPALLMRYFPEKARDAHIGGRALIECQVNTDGRTRDCKVTREDPEGFGFGEAALKVAAEFQLRPQLENCVPTDHGRMRIPISFPAR